MMCVPAKICRLPDVELIQNQRQPTSNTETKAMIIAMTGSASSLTWRTLHQISGCFVKTSGNDRVIACDIDSKNLYRSDG